MSIFDKLVEDSISQYIDCDEDSKEPVKNPISKSKSIVKRNYTSSGAVIKQRRDAALSNVKHGRQSKILKALGTGCDTCLVREFCKIKDDLDESHRDIGCRDIRNYYIEKLKLWGNTPIPQLVKTIAELDVIKDAQFKKDGYSGKLSPEYIKLVETMDKLVNTMYKCGIDTNNPRDARKMNFENIEEAEIINVDSVHKAMGDVPDKVEEQNQNEKNNSLNETSRNT